MITIENEIWEPLDAAPEYLTDHSNAIFGDNGSIFVEGCSKCETSVIACHCEATEYIDFLLYVPNKGVNRTQLDKMTANAAAKASLKTYQDFILSRYKPTDVICFMAKNDKDIHHDFVLVSEAITPNYFAGSLQLNVDYNIYLATNTFRPEMLGQKKGRTEDNVFEIRNLYVDVDENGPAIFERISASRNVPEATVILESSPNKYQFMWAVEGISKEDAKTLLQALAIEFGTDPAVAEVARVLRVPGFKNLKYPEAPVVKVVCQNGRTYSKADFKLEVLTLEKQPIQPKQKPPRDENSLIPHGHIHPALVSEAGRLRNAGYDVEGVEAALVHWAEANCAPPLDIEHVRQVARSSKNWEQGPPSLVLSGTQTPRNIAPATQSNWRDNFKAVGELEAGDVMMLIDGFLPEGTCFIGALPGEGKTLFGLSISKALTTGEPFLGQFDVPQITPVLYLIPESGGRAFRKRCEKFQIPDDPDLFLCRTISEGGTLLLSDPTILEAVRRLKPVVVLDTIVRFNESEDENQAMANKQLVDDMLALRHAGAIAVIGMHHATKAMRKEGMTLEAALRGTGDIAASADAVYGLLRDDMTYKGGLGPNEIEVRCLKPRDFDPPMPFRIAASRVAPSDKSMALVVSVIDENHDFTIVAVANYAARSGDRLVELVKADPTMTRDELSKATGESTWVVRTLLRERHWTKKKGGKGGAGLWTYDPSSGFAAAEKPTKEETAKDAAANTVNLNL